MAFVPLWYNAKPNLCAVPHTALVKHSSSSPLPLFFSIERNNNGCVFLLFLKGSKERKSSLKEVVCCCFENG
ncbi:MAG: hypothetical protein CFE24_07130 [Flavobacterium sp. BFFFF2]|nr:MAG: hypothetical protein CFE24_07130 [Flavobacterium sp. BFFFF2]